MNQPESLEKVPPAGGHSFLHDLCHLVSHLLSSSASSAPEYMEVEAKGEDLTSFTLP